MVNVAGAYKGIALHM